MLSSANREFKGPYRGSLIEPGEPGYVIKVLLATSSFAQEINFPLAERSVDKV
jgi:hypothetical protein